MTGLVVTGQEYRVCCTVPYRTSPTRILASDSSPALHPLYTVPYQTYQAPPATVWKATNQVSSSPSHGLPAASPLTARLHCGALQSNQPVSIRAHLMIAAWRAAVYCR